MSNIRRADVCLGLRQEMNHPWLSSQQARLSAAVGARRPSVASDSVGSPEASFRVVISCGQAVRESVSLAH